MKTLRGSWGFVGLLVIAAWFLGSVTQAGAETLKWRQSLHVNKAERIEVGDVPGHIVGVAEGAGLAFFETGEVATYSWKATIDYTKGSGPSQGYMLFGSSVRSVQGDQRRYKRW